MCAAQRTPDGMCCVASWHAADGSRSVGGRCYVVHRYKCPAHLYLVVRRDLPPLHAQINQAPALLRSLKNVSRIARCIHKIHRCQRNQAAVGPLHAVTFLPPRSSYPPLSPANNPTMPARLAGNVSPARINAFLRANSAATIAVRDVPEARRDGALPPAALTGVGSGCAGTAAAAASAASAATAAAGACGELEGVDTRQPRTVGKIKTR